MSKKEYLVGDGTPRKVTIGDGSPISATEHEEIERQKARENQKASQSQTDKE